MNRAAPSVLPLVLSNRICRHLRYLLTSGGNARPGGGSLDRSAANSSITIAVIRSMLPIGSSCSSLSRNVFLLYILFLGPEEEDERQEYIKTNWQVDREVPPPGCLASESIASDGTAYCTNAESVFRSASSDGRWPSE